MSPPNERPGSQAEELPLWHLQDRIETVHGEVKAMRAEQVGRSATVDKKLLEHEILHVQTKESLNAGNARFSAMEAKTTPRWSMLAAILAVATGMIWTASRYPDADKFEDMQKQFNSLQTEQMGAKRDVLEMRKDAARLETKVDSVEAKLDRLLSGQVRP